MIRYWSGRSPAEEQQVEWRLVSKVQRHSDQHVLTPGPLNRSTVSVSNNNMLASSDRRPRPSTHSHSHSLVLVLDLVQIPTILLWLQSQSYHQVGNWSHVTYVLVVCQHVCLRHNTSSVAALIISTATRGRHLTTAINMSHNELPWHGDSVTIVWQYITNILPSKCLKEGNNSARLNEFCSVSVNQV